MVDYWPQEENAVFDGNSYIIPCYPDGAISEMSSVKLGTCVAGRISVIVSAATGDGVGIALRASSGAGVPSRIPILFYGICKVTSSSIAGYYLLAGSFAMNNITTTYMCHQANTIAELALATAGGSYIMGLVLQGDTPTVVAGGDEVLLLVGKTA